MLVLMTFHTFSVPFQGCSVLISTDWLMFSVPPRFGGPPWGPAAVAATARARSRSTRGVTPAAVPASAAPAWDSKRRREMEDVSFLGLFSIVHAPTIQMSAVRRRHGVDETFA